MNKFKDLLRYSFSDSGFHKTTFDEKFALIAYSSILDVPVTNDMERRRHFSLIKNINRIICYYDDVLPILEQDCPFIFDGVSATSRNFPYSPFDKKVLLAFCNAVPDIPVTDDQETQRRSSLCQNISRIICYYDDVLPLLGIRFGKVFNDSAIQSLSK